MTSVRKACLACATTIALIAPAGGAEPARGAPHGPLAQCIAQSARRLDFSGAVLVDRHGASATYVRGLDAGPQSAPITAETRFNIGSLGKMFTAVAVGQLIEENKVGLDDPIGRYVEGLTPAASKVTIRQLLSHTSGFGDFLTPENRNAILAARALRDLVPLVATQNPAFTPGSKYRYSNTGYLLLGMVIERVSGQSYADYLRAHVFVPAQMTATSLDPGPRAGRAIGLTRMSLPEQTRSEPGPQRRSFGEDSSPLTPSIVSQDRGNPAGGAFSTVLDLHRFFMALQAGKLVDRSMAQQLVKAHVVGFPAKGNLPELDYGFGFGSGAYDGHPWFGHAGGLPGANTEANVFPRDGIIIVVFANRDPPSATKMYSVIRSALFHPAAMKTCADGMKQKH